MLIFGEAFVKNVLNYMPQWLMGGLKSAGTMLPAVGIAILMHYLPIKKFGAYMIFGFVADAFLQLPKLGVALVGVGFAINRYNSIIHDKNQSGSSNNGLNTEKAAEMGIVVKGVITGDEE